MLILFHIFYLFFKKKIQKDKNSRTNSIMLKSLILSKFLKKKKNRMYRKILKEY